MTLAVVEIRVHVGDDIVLETQEFAEYYGPWSVLGALAEAREAAEVRIFAGELSDLVDTPFGTTASGLTPSAKTHTADGVRLGYQISPRTPASGKWGG